MMADTGNPTLNALLANVREGALPVAGHSAKVVSGGVFVAASGTAEDGARFIPDALARGATVIVAGPGIALPEGAKAALVTVDEPRKALGLLAAARCGTDRMAMPVVGVTGTNGKTTVSYLIERLATAAGKKVGVLGTVAYRWPGVTRDASLTTPDCLTIHESLAAMAAAGCDLAVMEASSHALDQDRLAGLSFAAGVFTNLTQDHLDYHKDMETYFAAKAKLFREYLPDPATAVLNYDDPFGLRLLKEFPAAVGYGLTKAPAGFARLLVGGIRSHDRDGQHLGAGFGDEAFEVASPMPGRHNALNILAAMGAALTLGLPYETFDALADCHGAPGRLERIPNASGLTVFVDYAHTPDALENVLGAAREFTAGRLFAVFGCGGDRDRTKRPRMAEAVSRLADVAVLTSDNPRHEAPLAIIEDAKPGLAKARKVIIEPDRRRAIALALDAMRPEDVLVIAGKGHESYQQIGDVKHPFSDAAVVRELTGCA
ncbi:UDP-N-acetylmuramyl-tripeptide synthetase [Solidesulfovibrio fructosivorans JJ]]|uniref:UDP-N-acetylmuramoyl-L-alanyl-D-glutamate--2,6-diaminopimelate ligase n=1 Tax=Solidesulfovibrio fructosivorans JJ] TaxID=596151 RepID=E1JTV8_SOLFR|nr:UDP-N-acetylmuramoyl-L-alanyl-D-glutamate--2,6-diaminopimelate ligase [Solidesulfovibrio fructosivorans]EFL52237.1 UDP-N-acetylmuramyl-tripeptide synthetase [Solidesulfovibrio fructosivorans JJ]]